MQRSARGVQIGLVDTNCRGWKATSLFLLARGSIGHHISVMANTEKLTSHDDFNFKVGLDYPIHCPS